jgi:hypothetical protein
MGPGVCTPRKLKGWTGAGENVRRDAGKRRMV